MFTLILLCFVVWYTRVITAGIGAADGLILIIIIFFILPLFSPISWYFGSYSLVSSLQVSFSLRRGEGRERCFLRNTTQPSRFLTQWKHRTLSDRVSVHAPGPPQESLERDGTRTSRPAKPSPNPDNAGPIVRLLMGLPVTAWY